MYKAIVSKIEQIKPIPGADRIVEAIVRGNSVVVGIDTKVGDLGIYFNCDGKLHTDFLNYNNLVRYKDPETGEYKGGFFEEKGRVRAQKFKGVKSNGFWCPVSFVEYTGINPEILEDGFEFTELNGHVICEKYYTEQTLRAMAGNKQKARKGIPSFPKHTDTEQYKYHNRNIPDAVVILTEKVHGTSQRTGNVYVEEEYEDFKKRVGWRRFLPWVKPNKGYQIVNGTRNVVLRDDSHATWYKDGEKFRWTVIENWKNKLHKDEVVYFEVVGFTESGQPIMPSQPTDKIQDKNFRKKWGDKMNYTYGCIPKPEEGQIQTDIYVYRITRCNTDGQQVDYSWAQVKARCQELGIKHVPELFRELHNAPLGELSLGGMLDDMVETFMQGPSTIDQKHIREGVCVRVEPLIGNPYILKAKSWEFGVLEGFIRDDDSYVDREEIA